MFLFGSCVWVVLIQKTRERRRVCLFLVRGGLNFSLERENQNEKRAECVIDRFFIWSLKQERFGKR